MPTQEWAHESDETPIEVWLAAVKKYAARRAAEMNAECVRQFNETVAKAEAEETEMKIQQLLHDKLGPRTYMVEVERG